MARSASTPSSRSSSRLAAAALGFLVAALAAHPAAARACGYWFEDIADETTFDPAVIADPAVSGFFYDPHVEGFGPPCDAACERRELLADWAPHLPGVSAEDWAKVLFDADLPAIDGLIFFLRGKQPAPPAGFAGGSLARLPPAARDEVVRALYLVGFARRVEPFGAVTQQERWDEPPDAPWERRAAQAGDGEALQRNGEKALAATKDAFLRQRYAFLLLRLRFYRQDWPGAISFWQQNAAALDGPSPSLRWRARHYLAGAYWRSQRYADANLEIARLVAAAPERAGRTLRDFHPMEERDWQATLALAKSREEKAWLWALVGLTQDGTAAMAEIAKLDPRSRWLPLLAVREVNRLEAQNGSLDALGRLCADLAQREGVDRPWIFDAVAGHVAALRGDLAAARAHLGRVAKLAPASATAARLQAQVSLGIAIAHAWRPGDEPLGAELVRVVPSGEGRIATAQRHVRHALSATCWDGGLPVDAELFDPSSGRASAKWKEPKFVEALIARVGAPRTRLDEFMIDGSGFSTATLRLELARLHLVQGRFADAAKAAQGIGGVFTGTDPFVMHVTDCHDCDHAKYADASFGLHDFAARLASLEAAAGGQGEPAAQAAFELGSGLYNISATGNARLVLDGSHQALPDSTAAERWFRRAHELTKDPELKARAAAMAAKCELARHEDAQASPTWYPALRALEGTAYEQEMLRECGWYRTWKEGAAPRPAHP